MPKQYGTRPHRDIYYNTIQGDSGASTVDPANVPKPPANSILYTDVRSGVSNPGWKRKIANLQNATTSFTGTKSSLESNPGYMEHWFTIVSPWQVQTYWRRERKTWSHGMQLNAPSLPPLSDLTEATNVAQQKFYKSLESVMTLFSGGLNLVELQKTLHMIRNPAKSLRRKLDDYINAAKKRRRGSPTSKQGMLADLYLEHAFGWLPLLHDLDDATNYLAKRADQLEVEVIPVSGSGTVYKSGFINTSDASGSITASAELLRRDVSFSRYKGAVASRAASTKLVNMSSLGLAPRSFVPTLWEWLPWSFVADYFTNVGDVITAWSNQNVALAWGCQTTRRSRKLASMNVRFRSNVNYLVLFEPVSSSAGYTTAEAFEVKRAPISYVPLPSFSFEMPGYGKKWLNLAALAAARRSMTPF
jgi:hypothetical protein